MREGSQDPEPNSPTSHDNTQDVEDDVVGIPLSGKQKQDDRLWDLMLRRGDPKKKKQKEAQSLISAEMR